MARRLRSAARRAWRLRTTVSAIAAGLGGADRRPAHPPRHHRPGDVEVEDLPDGGEDGEPHRLGFGRLAGGGAPERADPRVHAFEEPLVDGVERARRLGHLAQHEARDQLRRPARAAGSAPGSGPARSSVASRPPPGSAAAHPRRAPRRGPSPSAPRCARRRRRAGPPCRRSDRRSRRRCVPAAAAISRMPVASNPFSPKPRSAASMIASRVVVAALVTRRSIDLQSNV